MVLSSYERSWKLGVNPDDICKEAIYGFGKMRGQKYSVADTPGKWQKCYITVKDKSIWNGISRKYRWEWSFKIPSLSIRCSLERIWIN